MTSCTPFRPRSTRWRRTADQPDLSSLAPSQIPRISRNPSELTAEATRRNVANLAGPAALHDNAVEVKIRMLALDPPVPPGLDLGVDLLVQVRHRARGDTSTPQ